MRSSVLIDAGPLIALFDRDDNYHEKVRNFIREKHFRFVSTTAVLTEVSHMLDFNIHAQFDFLEWVMNNGLEIHSILQGDIPRILALTKKYADLPMDFADATLVIAAEKTGIKTIISIDSDFDVYRLPGKLNIQNVFVRD